MTTTRNALEFEERRLRAVAMLRQQIPQAEIARKLEVTRQSVSRWAKAFLKLGKKGLHRKPRPGRPPKLSPSQRQALLNFLAQGPGKAGYTTQLWTAPRIRRLTVERFGISLHVNHIPKLLHQCGWSFQRPTTRARERNEKGIRLWVAKDWPRIKKKSVGSEPR